MNDTIAAQHPVGTMIYQRYNIYIYRADVLWISYGLTAGATFLCMAIGVSAMIRNQACYENVPSTFLRLTANMVTLRQIVQSDDDGSVPLPAAIGEARIPAWNGFNEGKGASMDSTEVAMAETESSLSELTSLTLGRYTIRRKPVPSADGSSH